jgi:hypothetical protein
MAEVPKIIRLNKRVAKDGKTLFFASNQDNEGHSRWKRWDTVVSSINDYKKWKDYANIKYIVLPEITEDDVVFLEKNKLFGEIFVFTTSKALNIRPVHYWQSAQNITFLDELLGAYAFIEKKWDGTIQDAVACIGILMNYNTIVDWEGSINRTVQLIELEIKYIKNSKPPYVYAITQYFVHKNSKRAREIRRCLMNNSVNPCVDKVILLNENDLSSEWSTMKGRKNIEQVVIGNRLRYSDLIKYTYESVPSNSIVFFMNADIYLDESINEVFKVNMTDRMFALLRWDTDENGNSPKLFGPHPDSQDTWIVSSDSIKSRSWDYTQFDYQLGRAGCDNRFTADMFANRFLICNPAQTIKTYHIHNTQIRDYNRQDIVPSKYYIYINPSSILDMNQQTSYSNCTDKGEHEPFDVTIRCPNEANGVTWCTMIGRHNRYLWKHNEPATFSAKNPIYTWPKSFMTHNGIVFDRSSIYTGSEIDEFMKDTDMPMTIDFITPKWYVPCVITVPVNKLEQITTVDRFILFYMSKVFNLLRHTDEEEACVVMPQFHKNDVSQFVTPTKSIQAIDWSPSVSIYAEKIVGYLPSNLEVTKEDIKILRNYFNRWNKDIISKSCIVLYNATSDTKVCPFTYEFVDKVKELLGSDWSVTAMDMYKSGADAYTELVGKQLCIFFGGEGMKNVWPKLWALPPGCQLVEFQNELKVDGEFQHMAAAADFDSWIMTLHKGTHEDMSNQAIKQLKGWIDTGNLK